MATNKKITQLDELTPATWADDDVIAIVDISAQETKKIQLSTFRGAVTGVSSLNASTPLTVDSATGDVTISVAINGGGTINAVFDEDNMASNSPTALATQQSIKAYVDSQVGTVDTLAEILANGNTSGGTNIVVSSGDVITTNTINETTAAAGVTIDSVLVKDGQVDGRDVSVDGTKLDTVETNADVTDTTNVTAAGALMDSELTNITAVKALNQGVATTDTPTFAGLVTAGNVDGRDVSVDGAKLDGIEAGADVTDATNVTAAGALMDSELTNIAAVKALDQGVATGDSPSFAGLTATTADINGGTIDGTVIGGSSAAAGTFTTFTSTGIDDNAASNALTIDSSGNLLVGTTSATTDLAYAPKLKLSGNGPGLYFEETDTSQDYSIAALGGKFYIRDATAVVPRLTIDSSGNVGIGTSSPLAKLHSSVSSSGAALAGGVNVAAFLEAATNTSLQISTGTGSSAYINIGDAADIDATRLASQPGFTQLSASGASDYLRFDTGGFVERMRIDSSGNVGIGITSPATKFHVLDGTSSLRFRQNGTVAETLTVGPSGGDAAIYLGDVADTVRAGLYYDTSENDLQIRGYNNSTRIIIDSSGNVGINTSSPDTLFTVDGQAIIGDLVAGSANLTNFLSGTPPQLVAGWSIPAVTWTPSAFVEAVFTRDGDMGVDILASNTRSSLINFSDTDDEDVGKIEYDHATDYMRFNVNAAERMRIDSSGVVRPGTDNIQSIGAASFRWSVVYAGTGTINTSDEREKQQIADLDDAERRVAVSIKGLVKKYKYNDAVTLKGDGARIHVGVIAQEVIAAFAGEGLDATRYALLCHDTWEAEPEEVDKNGNVINPGIEAGERYGIRYDELLAFMIAAL